MRGLYDISTFSLEAFSLIENHQISLGSVYIIISVGFCIVGIMLGQQLAKLMA